MLSGALKTTLPRVFPAQCCSRSIKTILLRFFFLYKVVWSLKDNIAQQLQWFNLCNVGPSRFQVCSLKDNITCCSGSIKTALHRIFFHTMLSGALMKTLYGVLTWVILCQMDQNFKGWDMTHLRFWWNISRWKLIYGIRLSWKFYHKLIPHSKVMTPQSWHGKLKISKTKY